MTRPADRGARGLILGRIRDVVESAQSAQSAKSAASPGSPGVRTEMAAAAYRDIPREYRSAAALDPIACADLMAARLEHYQVAVYRAEPATLAKTIATALTARHKARVVVPVDLDPGWLSAGIDFIPDRGLSFDALDRADGVLTGCSFAIANTGTIVLRHTVGEGRRALTLIPDYHLCVVHAAQIVETVPDAFRRVAVSGPPLLTTISGPSATADIEMTRIRGVHGPRTLDVVLVI